MRKITQDSYLFWLLAGVFTALGIAVLAVWMALQYRNTVLEQELTKQSDRFINLIYDRVNLYQYGLRGLRAYIQQQEQTTGLNLATFQSYSQARDYAEEFPGARGFGFIRRVPLADEAKFLAAAQQEVADFTIRQINAHGDERFVIQYIFPLETNKAAVGLDIASEPNRRAAATAAISEGSAQLTAPITLVQAAQKNQQSLLMLLPVYNTNVVPTNSFERWQRAVGWSYAPLLMEEILNSLEFDARLYHLRLIDIKDANDPREFYSIGSGQFYGAPQLRQHDMFGRIWQLELIATQELARKLDPVRPQIVFGLTFFTAWIALALLYSLSNYWATRKQLFKQAAHLAAIVETSNDAIIGQDTNGKIQSWNQGAARIFGFHQEEALGRTVLELLVPEELHSEELRLLDQLRQGQSEVNLATRRRCKSGQNIDVLVNVTPLFNLKGEVVGASKTLRDISALKRAERELKQLNTSLEQQVLLRTGELSKSLRENDAILTAINGQFLFSLTDGRGDIIQVNDNFCRASGYSREELLGKNHRILNSGHHPRSFWSELWSALREGKSWRAEVCNLTKDGEQRWFDTNIAPILDADGTIEQIIAVRSDITERKQTELYLKAARDQLGKASDVAKLGIWTWEVKTNELVWNARMFEIYAQNPALADQGLGYNHWRERLHPEDITQAETLMQQALEGTANFDLVFRILLPSGETRFIKAVAQIERDRFNRPIRATGINFDITDQQNLEASLRRAKELADEASAAKTQFLANMSHEIRTPMNGVLGMLELVKRTQLDRQQRSYINKADSAAKGLLGILNDILDYSKISAGKMVLDPIEFSLETMLRELGVILAGNQGAKPVEILLDKDAQLPDLVVADKLRLLQILINLAGNALKFTERGHVLVRLRRLKQDSAVVSIQVQIEDTGIGMTPAQQANLFQSFVQAEASTSRRFGGTGLGLVITKRLLELMGSQLHLESSLNLGSRFWFDLQLAYNPAPNASACPPKPLHTKLLIVDDHPLLLDLLANGLQTRGWQVQTATSAFAALYLIDTAAKSGAPFDAVLMDWNMPEMNGLEASIKIHAAYPDNAPKIIMITAHEKEVISQAGDQGRSPFDEILVKPVTLTQVEEVLIGCFNDKQLSATADVQTDDSSTALAGINILLVEDNELNRLIGSELLAMAGAQVSLATCGEEGVDAVLNTGGFDLVLMDVQMPDIDGFTATARIRSAGFGTLPIIALTANASESDRQACLAAGMNDHLGKPFDINVLIPLVQKYVPTRQIDATQVAKLSVAAGVAPKEPNLACELLEPLEKIIERFYGNNKLFLRVREQFKAEADTVKSNINQYYANENLPQLATIFHSLKGVSATIGAGELSRCAGVLEQQAKQNTAIGQDAINGLLACLEQSVQALMHIQFAPEPPESAQTLTQDQLGSLLADIQLDLRNSNMNAVKGAQRLVKALPQDPNVQILIKEIDGLDFAAAQATVNTIIRGYPHADAP